MKDCKVERRELYRRVPKTSACIGGCTACCGPVAWRDDELAAVADRLPATAHFIEVRGVRVLADALERNCPFAVGGCQVYADRPLVCRLYAAVDDALLACPFGVKARRPLSLDQSWELLGEYLRGTI